MLPLRQALPKVNDFAAVSDRALNVESFSALAKPSAPVRELINRPLKYPSIGFRPIDGYFNSLLV
jgi:hypothetical protein